MRRARRFALGVLRFTFTQPLFEYAAPRNHLALLRSNGPKLAAFGAAVEVGIGHLGGDTLHLPLDAYLALKLGPVEHERRPGMGGQLLSLAALIVGVEDNTFRADPLQQDHAR